jgi:acyl-CoA thioesterase FadM
LATGTIKSALVDTRTGKATRIPDVFRTAVADYQDG